jgi:Transmembrane secretion effector
LALLPPCALGAACIAIVGLCFGEVESSFRMKGGSAASALQNRVFLKIWLASLASGTAVAAHDTAATWMMHLISRSGLFISLMASLASLPFFLFTLPAGALADALNEGAILRIANL